MMIYIKASEIFTIILFMNSLFFRGGGYLELVYIPLSIPSPIKWHAPVILH